MTEDDSTDDSIVQNLQALMVQFELDNPELSKAIQTLGMTVDYYERILTESKNIEIRTSNSTDGSFAP